MPRIHYPSLLLVINTHQAVWFHVAEEERIQPIEAHIQPKEHFSDKEGRSQTGLRNTNARSGMSDLTNHERIHETNTHILAISHHTAKLWRHGSYVHLMIIAPETLKWTLFDHLNTTLPGISPVFIPGNHLQDDEETLKSLFKEGLTLFHTNEMERR